MGNPLLLASCCRFSHDAVVLVLEKLAGLLPAVEMPTGFVRHLPVGDMSHRMKLNPVWRKSTGELYERQYFTEIFAHDHIHQYSPDIGLAFALRGKFAQIGGDPLEGIGSTNLEIRSRSRGVDGAFEIQFVEAQQFRGQVVF